MLHFSLINPKLISLSMHYSIYLISFVFFPFLFHYLFIFNLSAFTSLSRNICFILIAMHSLLLLLLLRLRLCCFSRICLVYVKFLIGFCFLLLLRFGSWYFSLFFFCALLRVLRYVSSFWKNQGTH